MRHHRTAPHDQGQGDTAFFVTHRERQPKIPIWVNLVAGLLATAAAIAACSAGLGVRTDQWWMQGGLYLGALILTVVAAGSLGIAREKWRASR